MKKDLLRLDLEMLKNLYAAKENEIEAAILSGTSWQEINIQRKNLIELSTALHHKLQKSGSRSPADYPNRP